MASRAILCLFIVATALGGNVVLGQNFPTKPIRFVTVEPGGGSDIVSRIIAPGLTFSLGQQIIVENRGGGSGIIAVETVAKAPPDGYTLLSYGSIWILPFLRENLPYDPVRDFSPITLPASAPNVLVVHPSLPVKSVRESIALAKSRPGEINYGSGGSGSSNHLAAELFKALAQINIVRIPYKGAGAALNGLVGGQVQLMFASAASVAQQVKAGRVRALAVTSARESALLPELPTVAATLPGYEATQMYGIYAPGGTPTRIIMRLNQEIVRVLNTQEVKARLFNAGAEVVGNSPEEFAATIKSDMARWSKLIQAAGIHE